MDISNIPIYADTINGTLHITMKKEYYSNEVAREIFRIIAEKDERQKVCIAVSNDGVGDIFETFKRIILDLAKRY